MSSHLSVREELRIVGAEFARALMELAPHVSPHPLELLDVKVVDPTRGFLYRVDLMFYFTTARCGFGLQLTVVGTSIRRVRGSAPPRDSVAYVDFSSPAAWTDWAPPGEGPKSETSRRHILEKALEGCGLERVAL